MIRATALFPALLLLGAGIVAPLAAVAGTIDYLQDPVYQNMAPGDHHPMEDLSRLARQGDVRAQFILGDLYAKGKGGLPKNAKLARHWFETSAKNGYFDSFIRLAALAKHAKDPVEAYQWYTLAIEHFSYGKAQKYAITARNAVAADFKMTKAQIGEARAGAEHWKKSARQEALKAKEKTADKKKKSKVEEPAGPPEKKTEDSAPVEKEKTPPKSKAKEQKPQPAVKEYRLNE